MHCTCTFTITVKDQLSFCNCCHSVHVVLRCIGMFLFVESNYLQCRCIMFRRRCWGNQSGTLSKSWFWYQIINGILLPIYILAGLIYRVRIFDGNRLLILESSAVNIWTKQTTILNIFICDFDHLPIFYTPGWLFSYHCCILFYWELCMS